MDLVQLDVRVLALLAGVVVPLITAVVTKRWAASSLKAIVTTVLSVVAGGLAVALEAHGQVVLKDWVDGMFTAFIAAQASYVGLWKHTVAPVLADKTANVGIGGGETGHP